MKKYLFLISLILGVSFSVNAQNSRDYIKQNIREKNECKSVAISKTNGDAMIYGRNGYAAKACPSAFVNALSELNDENKEIQDINLSESGRWLILYGRNGMRWGDLYPSLEKKIKSFNDKGEKITTVTFNDLSEWIVITTEHISASSSEIQDWLVEGCDDYGTLWTACITDDACVAVYESGYRFLGDVPKDLKEALTSCTSDVFMVKMAGSAWFFSCTDGYWRYNM
jgi:hypothetical protein